MKPAIGCSFPNALAAQTTGFGFYCSFEVLGRGDEALVKGLI
jgi:hypothetical protein